MNLSPRHEKIVHAVLALSVGLCLMEAIILYRRHKVTVAQAVASSAALVASHSVVAAPAPSPIMLPLPPLPEVDVAGVRFYLPPGPPRMAGVARDLQKQLRLGASMLSSEHLDAGKCGGAGLGSGRCKGDYILAALSPEGEIQLIDLYENRPSDPPGFTIALEMKVRRVIGVNMPFTITSPPGWTVLALRTAIGVSSKSIATGKKTVSATEVVNVPYTARIDTPEVRKEGAEYLAEIAHRSLMQLRTDDVKSRLDPSKLVVETVDVRHVISLILTEQIYDDEDFVAGDSAKRLWMISRELVTLGANHESAFRYTRSHSDAVGLAQITPSTRDLLIRAYGVPGSPTPELDPRLDHQQALELSLFHADDELSTLRNLGLLGDLQEGHLSLALAAGYNAKLSNTVADSLRQCGLLWRSETCTNAKHKPILRPETLLYLKKYEWIHAVLFDENSARHVAEEFKVKPY